MVACVKTARRLRRNENEDSSLVIDGGAEAHHCGAVYRGTQQDPEAQVPTCVTGWLPRPWTKAA